jgi:hypothetical protein
MARICRLIEAAAIQAIETGHECMDVVLLAEDLTVQSLPMSCDLSVTLENWRVSRCSNKWLFELFLCGDPNVRQLEPNPRLAETPGGAPGRSVNPRDGRPSLP